MNVMCITCGSASHGLYAVDSTDCGNAGCHTQQYCNVSFRPHVVHWNVNWQRPINEISTDSSRRMGGLSWTWVTGCQGL